MVTTTSEYKALVKDFTEDLEVAEVPRTQIATAVAEFERILQAWDASGKSLLDFDIRSDDVEELVKKAIEGKL